MKSIIRAAAKDDLRDFRQTPEIAVAALVASGLFSPHRNYHDPACGASPIGRVLRGHGYPVSEHDLFIDGVDFLSDQGLYDTIVMNPPYNRKYEFLNHSFEIGRRTIAILPMQWVNYNITIKQYLSRSDFVGKVLLTPKFFMTEEYQTTLAHRGGNTAYAWFVWDRENSRGASSQEWYVNLDTLEYTSAVQTHH
jgi:hypothetical protein